MIFVGTFSITCIPIYSDKIHQNDTWGGGVRQKQPFLTHCAKRNEFIDFDGTITVLQVP